MEQPPRVFISYSHDSPEHAERVLALANRLRADGVEAVLDQFEEFGPPEGWPRWMTKHLREADFVVMVCTERYYARVMGLEKPGTGQGVRWEGNQIFQYLYEADTINRRFLPVLFDDGKPEHIPDPLRSFQRYQLDDEHGYLQLYRRLTNQPTVTAPALGQLKALAQKERKQNFFSEPHHNIPLPGPVEFVGRAEAFTELDRQLQQTSGLVAITSVAGMGGVGKTELAIRYARSRLATFPGGVCWVKVRGADLATQILGFAQIHFDLVPPETLHDAPSRIGYCWAHWPGHERVLIVLDDVTAWDVIQPLLPKAERFCTLITTRRTFRGVQPVRLDVLAAPDSFALLNSVAGGERCEGQRADAERLCEWLGHLPLGLELVGRYLAGKADLSLCEMLSRLERKGLDHPSTKRADGLTTAELGVAAAFDLTWEELSQPARDLGCLLSLFALAPIPWNTVQVCFPSTEAEDLEDLRDSELLNTSLLQRKGEGLYQLHQLMREFFREKLSSLPSAAGLRKAIVVALSSAARQVPDQPTLDGLAASAPLIPHFEELADRMLVDLDNDDLICPFVALQRLYEVQSLFAQAEAWATRGVTVARARFGPEHPDVALSLNNLAELYRAQGRYAEAEPLFQQALEMRRKQLGPEHPDVAQSLNNLARLYRAQGRYAQAEPLYQQALEVRLKQLGPEHPDVAQSLNNLAALYATQARYAQAEPLYQQALEIQRKQLGPEHPDVAASLHNLAVLYGDQGRYAEAEPLCQQALAIAERALGSSHPTTKRIRGNLETLKGRRT